VAALAGCSGLGGLGENTTDAPAETPVDRIVVRSDTGRTEPLRLTLVYGPPDGNTERPVWTTVEAPADGDPATAVLGPDTGHGVYSLTAASTRHGNHEVVSFNSRAQERADAYQFAVVVQAEGDVWATLDEAGQPISIPGDG
jgi:hypothetical protein